MPQPPEHWLYDRGLSGQNVMAAAEDSGGEGVNAIMPSDYVARVQALVSAVEWTKTLKFPTPERTLQRALDFHAFLMGRETKEPVHTDD